MRRHALLTSGAVVAAAAMMLPYSLAQFEQPREPARVATDRAELQPLNPLVGRWNVSAKIWLQEGQEPIEVTGTAYRMWTLNHRFLSESVSATAMHRPDRPDFDQFDDETDDPTFDDPQLDDPQVDDPPQWDDPNARLRAARQDQNDPMQPGWQPADRLAQRVQSIDGMALIGFDAGANQFELFWADGVSGNMAMVTGRYDTAARTFTFTPRKDDSLQHGEEKPQPRRQFDQPDEQPERHGLMDRVKRNIYRHAEITLRIVDDSQHVIEIASSDPAHKGQRIEITYSKERVTGVGEDDH